MASWSNNSSLEQGLHWIIGFMVKFEKEPGSKVRKTRLTILWQQVRGLISIPTPTNKRAHLAIFQSDFGKAYWKNYLSLVLLESGVPALHEGASVLFCMVACHHWGISLPLWGWIHCCMIRMQARSPWLDFYTVQVVCPYFVMQTDVLKPSSAFSWAI